MSKSLENLKLDAAELYRLAELTERRRVKDILTIEAKKIETEVSLSQEKENGILLNSSNKDTSVGRRTYDVKLSTYAWDQSDSSVKVFVNLPKVETLPAENIQCSFGDTSFELRVNDLDGKNYILPIKNLHSSVKPEKCSWKVKSGNVIITLPKCKEDTWSDLVWKESKIKKPPKLDETVDPSAGIMNLMKQMYDDGDDEMKRTIAKAWYESREKNMNIEM